MSRKRGHSDSDDEEYDENAPLPKRQKRLPIYEKCKELTGRLQEHMTILGNFLTANSLVDDSAREDMDILSIVCNSVLRQEEDATVRPCEAHADVLGEPLDVLGDDALAVLPQKKQRQYKAMISLVNSSRSLLQDSYLELLKSDRYPPSASYYAKPTEWVKWQTKPAAILNLRPSKNVGLPLATLHPIFARFNAALEQSLPDHSNAHTAMAYHSAFRLCMDMADSFQNNVERRDAFETCVKPLFPDYSFVHGVTLEPAENSKREFHTFQADMFVYGDQRVVMAAEFKAEFMGDAYMKVSRVYQTWVNRQLDQKHPDLSHGLPMVVICVIGPLLITAGGFFDGKSVIVEPLGSPCLMLPDNLRKRQEALARVLAATKEAVESLSRLEYAAPATFAPGTPRVYPTFSTPENGLVKLTFNSRLIFKGSQDPNQYLLFLGTSPISPAQVLVKLIAGDRYGTGAHEILAKAGFAPALYGVAKVQGAPTAYVMEYLSPSNGWETLHEYARHHGGDVGSHIHASLESLFVEMETHNIVHGDFRPNNIMIRRVEDGYELKVIDFDWAGESGQVNYPLCRNEGIPWPGRPNDPIVIPHDRTLLNSCLSRTGER